MDPRDLFSRRGRSRLARCWPGCSGWCALILGLAMWTGCATGASMPDPQDASSGKTGKVTVGGSDKDGATFVDWSSGTVTPLIISGPQGGQHIWVSVRAHDVSPSKLRMAVQMFDAETNAVVAPGRVEITHTMNVKADGTLEYTGIPAFVKFPCSIRGRKVHVHLEINDLYGVSAQDDATITPYWDGWCPPDSDASAGSDGSSASDAGSHSDAGNR